jgi:hypothetical protein
MADDYSKMSDDALHERAENGDTAAHFEQGRRSALAEATPPKPEKGRKKLNALRSRYGMGGWVLWGLFMLGSIAIGPACVAGLLYTAYYAADDVYFGYHDYSLVQMAVWYIGTFLFIGLMLRMATLATQYLLKKRPLSTVLIIVAVCWYLVESSPLENLWPK